MATSEVHSHESPRQRVDDFELPADEPLENEDEEVVGGTMTLVEHLEELRHRLFVCMIAIVVGAVAGFFLWDKILGFLLSPLPHLSSQVFKNGQLIVHDPGEPFMIALKLALAAGFALALPVTLYQVWAFIAPAL